MWSAKSRTDRTCGGPNETPAAAAATAAASSNARHRPRRIILILNVVVVVLSSIDSPHILATNRRDGTQSRIESQDLLDDRKYHKSNNGAKLQATHRGGFRIRIRIRLDPTVVERQPKVLAFLKQTVVIVGPRQQDATPL
jgi:hypothetical protein